MDKNIECEIRSSLRQVITGAVNIGRRVSGFRARCRRVQSAIEAGRIKEGSVDTSGISQLAEQVMVEAFRRHDELRLQAVTGDAALDLMIQEGWVNRLAPHFLQSMEATHV